MNVITSHPPIPKVSHITPFLTDNIELFCQKRTITPVSIQVKGKNTRVVVEATDDTVHSIYPHVNRWVYKKPIVSNLINIQTNQAKLNELTTEKQNEFDIELKRLLTSQGIYIRYIELERIKDVYHVRYNRFSQCPRIIRQASTVVHNNNFIEKALIYPNMIQLFYNVVDEHLDNMKVIL